jgi:8-oxo-dGTP pyrophosphatase MutT (NUDIX family)
MVNYKFGNNCFNLRTSCVLLHSGKVLLQYDDTGATYVLPGGRPELHEDSSVTLKREMIEELGIDVKIERLLYVAENFFVDSDINCHEISFIYLANPVKAWDELGFEWPYHTKEGNLNIYFDWFDTDKLENIVLYPVFLRKALNQEMHSEIRHLIIRP